MLDKVTHATFAELVGSKFFIRFSAGAPLEVELVSATLLASGRPVPGGTREPFSLIFRGGPPDSYLPQRMYPITHEKIGTLELFLVPIGPDQVGMRYEAIFN
jgi:hypothetical protein